MKKRAWPLLRIRLRGTQDKPSKMHFKKLAGDCWESQGRESRQREREQTKGEGKEEKETTRALMDSIRRNVNIRKGCRDGRSFSVFPYSCPPCSSPLNFHSLLSFVSLFGLCSFLLFSLFQFLFPLLFQLSLPGEKDAVMDSLPLPYSFLSSPISPSFLFVFFCRFPFQLLFQLSLPWEMPWWTHCFLMPHARCEAWWEKLIR